MSLFFQKVWQTALTLQIQGCSSYILMRAFALLSSLTSRVNTSGELSWQLHS